MWFKNLNLIYKKYFKNASFIYNNTSGNIFYSNYPRVNRQRKIKIDLNNNKSIIYNDSSINKLILIKNKKSKIIKNKNYSTLEEILIFFYKQIIKNKKINELNFSKDVMKIVFNIIKKLN